MGGELSNKSLREERIVENETHDLQNKSKKIKKSKREMDLPKKEIKIEMGSSEKRGEQGDNSMNDEPALSTASSNDMFGKLSVLYSKMGNANTSNFELLDNLLDGLTDEFDDRVLFVFKNSESVKVIAIEEKSKEI